MGHSCGTLLRDTLVKHSCGTLLRDTPVGHSCGTLIRDTPWDTLVGHFCRTLLWDTLVGHTLRTRLPPKVTLRGCKTSVSSKRHASSLNNEHFVRDFLQKSHVKSPKRAFRTRLPPKVTRQGSKTSVSYETSSKTDMSNSAKRAFRTRLPQKQTCQTLQNERFVRDFLPKSSGNTHRSTPIVQPCQAVSRFQPLQTTSAHTPIPM